MATRWGGLGHLLRLQLHHIEYAMMHLQVAARRAVAVVAGSAADHDVADHDDQVNDDSQFLHSQVWRELARLLLLLLL